MKDHEIRPLERGDLERVGHLVDVNEMFPSDMLEEMTASYFSGGESQRWLVSAREEVDAVAYFVPEPLTEGCWNLLLIAVDPKVHGQGIGQALMARVEADLGAQGERILLVETSGKPDFERTRSFYRQLDYDEEARVRDYYADGDDKIIFRKALA